MKKKRELGMPRSTFFRAVPMRLREYWTTFMDSTQKKMSRGAQNISKIIQWPRNENWRRKEKKK